MKYLGLTIDSHWSFGAHFERLVPSVEATANALGCLLPRLGGPGVRERRLYAGVVRSRLLYEAPMGGGSDGQPPQSPEGLEAAQDGGHQGSEGHPHHFGGSSGGVRRVSPVRIAGPEVLRDLSPHSESVGRDRPCGRRR